MFCHLGAHLTCLKRLCFHQSLGWLPGHPQSSWKALLVNCIFIVNKVPLIGTYSTDVKNRIAFESIALHSQRHIWAKANVNSKVSNKGAHCLETLQIEEITALWTAKKQNKKTNTYHLTQRARFYIIVYEVSSSESLNACIHFSMKTKTYVSSNTSFWKNYKKEK